MENLKSSPPQILRIWDEGGFDLGVSGTILRELEFALSKTFFQQRSDRSLREYLIERNARRPSCSI